MYIEAFDGRLVNLDLVHTIEIVPGGVCFEVEVIAYHSQGEIIIGGGTLPRCRAIMGWIKGWIDELKGGMPGPFLSIRAELTRGNKQENRG